MFIDFGAGYDLPVIGNKFKHIPEFEQMVAIDRRPDFRSRFPEFFDLMDKHYTKVDNMWIKKTDPGFKFYDCYIQDDIRNNIDILEPADVWRCVSTLEHVYDEEVEDFMKGLLAKIQPWSNGYLHIDLTDHRKYPPDPDDCFYHYENEEWGRSKGKYYTGLYLNRIRKKEWVDMLSQWFTYTPAPSDNHMSLSWANVRLKNG